MSGWNADAYSVANTNPNADKHAGNADTYTNSHRNSDTETYANGKARTHSEAASDASTEAILALST